MARWTKANKERLFYLWYDLGCPSMNYFSNWLQENIDKCEQNLTRIERAPTRATLLKWKNEKRWDARADDLQRELRAQIDAKSIAARQDVFDRLVRNAMESLEAERRIFVAARLNDLAPEEARKLLPFAATLCQHAIHCFEHALSIASMDNLDGTETSRADASDLFHLLDIVFGKESGKIRMAIAAKLDGKEVPPERVPMAGLVGDAG